MSLIKDILSDTVGFFKQALWVAFYFVVFFVLIGLGTWALAAEKPVGWQWANPEVKELEHLKIISTLGDQGGEVALICNTKTKRINVTYNIKGVQYDFFVLRNFGDFSQDPDEKLIAGANIMTQADVYWHLMRDEHAFSVARFPVGSKKIWADAVAQTAKGGKDVTPNLQQEGEEYFITGPQIKVMLGELNKFCPLTPKDNRPVI